MRWLSTAGDSRSRDCSPGPAATLPFARAIAN